MSSGPPSYSALSSLRQNQFYSERPDIIPKVMHWDDILSTNAFNIFNDLKSPAGLFLTASRLNHSCIPYADCYCDDKSGGSQFSPIEILTPAKRS